MNSHGDRGLMGPLLVMLPGIVGAVVGAPLIGRELESGVFRYSWTQGVGRMRWAVAVIIPDRGPGRGADGRARAPGHLAQRADGRRRLRRSDWTPRRSRRRVSPWSAGHCSRSAPECSPDCSGAGSSRRWPPPSRPGSGWPILASVLRPHLLTPLTTAGQLPAGSLDDLRALDEGRGGSASPRSARSWRRSACRCRRTGSSAHVDKGGSAPPDPIAYLSEHGYTQVHTYQPDSRYWTFQWIELGWLVLVSVVLLGLTFWLVRRRSA